MPEILDSLDQINLKQIFVQQYEYTILKTIVPSVQVLLLLPTLYSKILR